MTDEPNDPINVRSVTAVAAILLACFLLVFVVYPAFLEWVHTWR